ncbi:MAG: c-type cytochrome [Longimicrobiales bacterium]
MGLTLACSVEAPAIRVVDGDPQSGRAAVEHYDCGACHTIPGIADATSPLAPPLTRFAERSFVNGLPNVPEVLVAWIIDPQALDSLTPMPRLGVSQQDARDIAAYLYTLR